MKPTSVAYSELQTAYDHYNTHLFDGKLPECLITFQREKRAMGYFSASRFVHREDQKLTDEIAMNPSYFAVVSVVEVMQTLVHEMVHLWQFHFGKPSRRTYHNREWAEKMEEVGLMPSDTGSPGGAKTGERMADYPIEGGPFLSATEALIKSSFGISWLDRFPPASKGKTHIFFPEEWREEQASDEQEQGAKEAQEQTISALQQALQPPDVGAALVMPSPRENKSNRVKYRCPNCEAQVWGKPGLLIKCGQPQCELEDMEVD